MIPGSFATVATGRDVSITIFTASSLNSGEKLLFLRVKIINLPDIILMDDCPGSSGHLMPARVTVYFVLALALFYGDSYEEVMRKLVQGLSWLAIWKKEWHVPTASALAQARERLGSEPLRELFERAAVPCAQLSTAGAWLGGRRLMSLDGVELHAADTPANAQYFGRKSGKDGTGAFPLVLVMALAECGTHAAAGADFCVRVPAGPDLPVLEWLPDGSYRSYVPDPRIRNLTSVKNKLASGALAPDAMPGLPVRAVDYTLPGRGSGEVVTLVTSILDHQDAPAPDLAAAYHERWEIELAFGEIKTRQRGPGAVLRSRSPDLVIQELYGLLLTHYAVRQLMTEAADQAELDPDRLSFTRTLNIVRRQVTAQAGFSPPPPEPGHR